MFEHRQIPLKLVSGPGLIALVTAPPIHNAGDRTVDFTCGDCGIVLMHADQGQIHNLVILCQSCGSYNSTDQLRPSPSGSGEAIMERFIHRQNLEHYRRLLDEPHDAAQHHRLLQLLAEEEMKVPPPKPV